MANKNKVVNIENTDKKTEALKLLEHDRNERITKCSSEIDRILENYKCALDLSMIIRAGQILPQIKVISK